VELDSIKKAGLKVILLINYDDSPNGNDASLEWVLKHIEQLEPIYNEYKDIIFAYEAGFIGAWGEWHTSSHNLDKSDKSKNAIKDALLKSVPKDRMVLFRNPSELIRWYPSPLDPKEAFSGLNQARVGFHNDCFIANITGGGTYSSDATKREEQLSYMEASTKNVAVGGEICEMSYNQPSSTASCENAINRASRLHYTFLSGKYHEPTIDIYKQEGCWDEISNRLGYRLELINATFPINVEANLSVSIGIKNIGFSSLFNKRTAYLVLLNDKNQKRFNFQIDSDPRKWYPNHTQEIKLDIKLPKDMPKGKYSVALWLPDASIELQKDPRYSIRFANDNIWDSVYGFNSLGKINVN
jgi:hypothetical protein